MALHLRDVADLGQLLGGAARPGILDDHLQAQDGLVFRHSLCGSQESIITSQLLSAMTSSLVPHVPAYWTTTCRHSRIQTAPPLPAAVEEGRGK